MNAKLESKEVRNCAYFGFEADDLWAELSFRHGWHDVAGVATDSSDRVYVFNRGDHPVSIFDREGTYLQSWGEGVFSRPHGIFLGPDDAVYCTDDCDHTVRKFTCEGRLLWTLGSSGKPSDTGATSLDYRTIQRAGPPFHYPTNLAVGPKGDLYVSDGYGNARVHKFAPDGELLLSWGAPGDGPGEFHVPHGIAVDRRDIVYVADRENSRIQLFTAEGEYLAEWTDLARPSQVFIDPSQDVYVAELGYHAGRWPGSSPPSPDASGGRLSIFDREGNLRARWGGGDFYAPHDIWVDSHGAIYVGEVVRSAGGGKSPQSRTYPSLRKFRRRAARPSTRPCDSSREP